jgi:hypothetical protein
MGNLIINHRQAICFIKASDSRGCQQLGRHKIPAGGRPPQFPEALFPNIRRFSGPSWAAPRYPTNRFRDTRRIDKADRASVFQPTLRIAAWLACRELHGARSFNVAN